MTASEERERPDRPPYWTNISVYAACSTAEQAIALFRTTHPTANLHKIERRNRMGTEGVLFDTSST